MKAILRFFVIVIFLVAVGACVYLLVTKNDNDTEEYAILYLDANSTDFSGIHQKGAPRTHIKGTVTQLKSATRDEYKFEGWFKDLNAMGQPLTQLTDEDFGSLDYITLYAKWGEENTITEPTQEYTVTFDKQGGDGGTDSVKVEYGQSMPNAIAPTRDGYDFVGYFDQIADGVEYYSSTMSSSKVYDKQTDSTLYARWQQQTPQDIFVFSPVNGGYSIEAKDPNNLPSVLNIPGDYQGQPILEIADRGFIDPYATNNSTVESIIIGDRITKIGNQAFKFFSKLKNLVLPNTLVDIDSEAFLEQIALRVCFCHKV